MDNFLQRKTNIENKRKEPEMVSLTRRLRILEEKITNLTDRIKKNENELIKENKNIMDEHKINTSDISEIKLDISKIKSKILLIIKELKLTAKKEEVEVLEKYINLWNPVKFITKKEVENIVRDMMKNGGFVQKE